MHVKAKLNLISTGWPIQLGDSVSIGESLLAFFALLICSSLSNEAKKTKPLNVERPQQFQLSLKI